MEPIMNIEKVNEFDFLNKEIEEYTSRSSQSLVIARGSSYLKENF